MVAANRKTQIVVDLDESVLAARAAILNAALASEYNLCGEPNITKRVQALAERGFEHPVKLRD